ncbi:MAG: restriction endonuclease subunit S, partial [Nitrososphaeria archaeon]
MAEKLEFYRETNFKETPIGKIPEDWEVVRLREVLLLLRNGLTTKQNKEGRGYPITRIETISEEKID